MVIVTSKRKVLSIKGRVKVIQQIENGKRKLTYVGIWSHKYCDPNNLEKQNQNYLHV
jgi:hypothetical protein